MKVLNTKTIDIVIGGDLIPDDNLLNAFGNAKNGLLECPVYDAICDADLSIVNLECPVIEKQSGIIKSGPVIGVTPHMFEVLNFIDIFSLANNHIMDHGSAGLESTINAIQSIGSSFVGVGENANTALKLLIRPVNGVRVAILAISENEFGTASLNTPGAAPIDLISITRLLSTSRSDWDTLVVLVHGGLEHLKTPTPRLRNLCHFLVDMGASAVICQHTHCVGAMEYYNEKPIIYGQGNFYFRKPSSYPKHWFEGFLTKLTIDIDEPNKISFSAIPFFQSRSPDEVFLVDKQLTNESFMEDFRKCSSLLSDEFVRDEFNSFVKLNADRYLSILYGKGPWWRRFRRLLNIAGKTRGLRTDAVMLNTLRCESFRDSCVTLLESSIDDERKIK